LHLLGRGGLGNGPRSEVDELPRVHGVHCQVTGEPCAVEKLHGVDLRVGRQLQLGEEQVVLQQPVGRREDAVLAVALHLGCDAFHSAVGELQEAIRTVED
jgi:hypothetical protein